MLQTFAVCARQRRSCSANIQACDPKRHFRALDAWCLRTHTRSRNAQKLHIRTLQCTFLVNPRRHTFHRFMSYFTVTPGRVDVHTWGSTNSASILYPVCMSNGRKRVPKSPIKTRMRYLTFAGEGDTPYYSECRGSLCFARNTSSRCYTMGYGKRFFVPRTNAWCSGIQ